MAAGFQKVIETNEVALNVAVGVGNAIADSSLRSKVYHHINLIFRENFLD